MIMQITKRFLSGRDIHEENRTATSLELFYDLIFVVAIANVSAAFHHDLAGGHISHGIISFFMVFMSIWWAWNQYTWFASAYDNDSAYFRLATLWQMVGALLLAAGVENAFNGNFTISITGYVIIRLASISLWLKVAKDNPSHRKVAMIYAIGIFLCQIAWVSLNLFPFYYWMFFALWLAEFAIPYFAESHTQTGFHAEHIEERFGLLTIIVLGESILASVHSLKTLIDHFSYDILFVAIGCILTLFGIWWLYFNNSLEHILRRKSVAFRWGYGHYIIFSSAAAIGAMVSVNVDVLTGHAEISIGVANLGFAIAVAVYLFGLWFCQEQIIGEGKAQSYLMLLVGACVIGLGFMPHTILTIGVLIIVTVIYRQYNPLIKLNAA